MGQGEQRPAWAAFAARLGLTAAAACTAESITYPIDMVKTRLQLQGELQGGSSTGSTASVSRAGAGLARTAAGAAPRQLGALRLAADILKHEGTKGLYAGLGPAAVRHVFYSGTRISVYEALRGVLVGPSSSSSSSSGSSSSQAAGLGTAALMGLVSGAVGQTVAVPADLIKVRMQADGRLVAAGKLAAPRYTGMGDALRKVVGSEGVVGLWRGCLPAVQRAALVNLGELAAYDTAKHTVLGWGVADGPLAHAMSSCMSGFVAATVSTPADVIKTRIMNQDPANRMYRGMVDCALKCVKTEGVGALYKGFFPTWARLGPWQLVFWVTYERMRAASGLGSF